MRDTAQKLVYVIDGKGLSRDTTAAHLNGVGYQVLPYESGAALLRERIPAQDACILLDINPMEGDGLPILRRIQALPAPPPVITLMSAGSVVAAVEAMKLGAADCLVKPVPSGRLLQSVEEVFHQLSLRRRWRDSHRAAEAKLSRLTPRERQVLAGLIGGAANKMIAYRLGISPRTVEIHRANLMAKLNAAHLSEVLRIAFAAGMAPTIDNDELLSGQPGTAA